MVPNGGCHFDSFAMTSQISVLSIIADSLSIDIEI